MVPDVGQDHKRRKWQDQPICLGKCLCPEGCRAWTHGLGKNRISPGQSQRLPPAWTLGSLDNESKNGSPGPRSQAHVSGEQQGFILERG